LATIPAKGGLDRAKTIVNPAFGGVDLLFPGEEKKVAIKDVMVMPKSSSHNPKNCLPPYGSINGSGIFLSRKIGN
jgi:hypothetical protein